jgi:hypothetical protein
MAQPTDRDRFEQGLTDQARAYFGLVGNPPKLANARETVRSAHTRWINGEVPSRAGDADHRKAFVADPDTFGTPSF